MNLKVVTRNVGIALLLNALFMYISAIVSAIYGFDASFSPLLLSAIITTVAGGFPLIFVRKFYSINIKEGFTIVVLSWVLSCLFGMLPYVLYGGEFTIINSWFESVSGYTTTGSTILNDIESIPKGLLFWRSSTHWLGGIGVVLFMLLVLPAVSSFRMRLSKMEISSLSKDNFKFKAYQTIRVISIVYLGLTLLETLMLMLAGMSFFDAINHSFATIATGGFSTKNLSIKSFDSVWIDIIIMLFMLLSGIHFGLLYSAFSGKSSNLFRSPVVRYYLLSILAGAIIVTLNIKFSGIYTNWGTAIREGFFQVVSVGTTTGFANGDSSIWPGFSILIIIFFTIQCACSGSTSGGMKADRVLIFFLAVRAQIIKQIHPNAVVGVKMGNQTIDKEVIYSTNLFIVLYILIVFISALFLTGMGTPLLESFSASAACMGNVGPGFGKIGSLGNYASIPFLGKLLLTIQMLLGRLEIYALLLIFALYRRR
ncbi:MAG TPA: cation transporter [Rikenellaceae bacterium]|jgi:trk system potassium uptake protein TrkH|nr:MAG: cation transporter [Bacteroidetes bacterium HGW-Bacteroidetes-5]HBZ25851.1 cation transporter [Rikenellaceae bacterium]